MLGVASRSDIKQQIATIDMTIEIYNLQVLGRVLGKLNQVPDVIDARRLHGGNNVYATWRFSPDGALLIGPMFSGYFNESN